MNSDYLYRLREEWFGNIRGDVLAGLVVALALTTYCLIGPVFKEARFRHVYGASFERYARSVPYWLPLPRNRN